MSREREITREITGMPREVREIAREITGMPPGGRRGEGEREKEMKEMKEMRERVRDEREEGMRERKG